MIVIKRSVSPAKPIPPRAAAAPSPASPRRPSVGELVVATKPPLFGCTHGQCPARATRRAGVGPSRTRPRWLAVAVTLAIAPKCLLCLLAYTGFGATFVAAVTGRELCGGAVGAPGFVAPLVHILPGVALGGLLVRLIGFELKRRRRLAE